MPLREDDPFTPVLMKFLQKSFNPHLKGPGERYHAAPTSPLTFYDRHYASNLLLKSVKPAPWLPTRLEKLCDSTIDHFLKTGHKFRIEDDDYVDIDVNTAYLQSAYKTFRYYDDIIGILCRCYASKFIFHPDDINWFTTTDMEGEVTESFRQCSDLICLGKEHIPHDVSKHFADWVLPALTKLKQQGSLAIYEFFQLSTEGKNLLQKMGSQSTFKWNTSTTIGIPSVACPPLSTPDSPSIGEFISNSTQSSTSPHARSKPSAAAKRSDKGINISQKSQRRSIVVAPVRRPKFRKEHYRLDVDQFLQAAWIRAIERDATFIIFNCGKYERIGIRHRETQTLYLSDIIDPGRCTDPHYGKLHMGLTIAMTQDALNRMNVAKPPPAEDAIPVRNGKRPLKESQSNMKKPPKKKRKLNRAAELRQREIFDKEISQRDLVLLSLDFGRYRSPAPSAFLRLEPSCVTKPFEDRPIFPKRKPSYMPQNYIALTTSEPKIGQGSLGVAFRVRAEIELESGEHIHRDMILKLSRRENDQNSGGRHSLVYEYNIYKRLASAGATLGIIGVHGLFQDMETGLLGILMDDAGESLRAIRDKMPRPADPSVEYDSERILLNESQRDDFMLAIDGVHRAGILHDDLRLDNLTLKETGEVYIIDFDICLRDVSEEEYEQEMRELLNRIGWPDYYGPEDSEEE